jgi:ketosteroid isomerase-like protein
MPQNQSVEDYVAVQAAFARYVWALDTADLDALKAIFTEDAVFEDTAGNVYDSREKFLDYARGLTKRPEFRGRQHHIDKLLIEPTDDGLFCRSYWTVTKWHTAENKKIIEVVGWSEDHFRRTDEGLLFSERRVHYWRDTDCPWVDAG